MYKDKLNRVLFVGRRPGLNLYCTLVENTDNGVLVPIKSRHLPCRKKKSKAQSDLDLYARKFGLEPVVDTAAKGA